jgi:hypothetical protein
MPEHPVKLKLQNEMLPYLVTARRLDKQWFYRTHLLFGYTTDILVVLTAIGVISPVYSEIFATNRQAGNATSFSVLTNAFPSDLYYLILFLVLVWTFLRVAYSRENGQERAVMAKSSQRVMRGVEAELPHVLGNPNPMPDITKLCTESIWPTADRCIQEKAWTSWRPSDPLPPDIEREVKSNLEDLCRKYESQWQIVDERISDTYHKGGQND